MIKIGMPNSERIHSLLSYLIKDKYEEGEEWRKQSGDDKGESENPVKIANIKATSIELPEPLNYVCYNFLRKDSRIELNAQISSRTKDAFKGLSRDIAEELAKRKLTFFRTSADATGYILNLRNVRDNSLVPSAVILDCESGISRIISAGSFGSEHINFTDSDSLTIDIGLLNDYVNTIIDRVYRKVNKTRPGEKTLDIALAFPPI